MRYLRVNMGLACLSVVLLASLGSAGDWPRFRGPNGSGIAADEKAAPTKWSPTENLKWKIELPGPGVSSPIVVGDRVFVTCYSGYGVGRGGGGKMEDLKRHLVCVDRNKGTILWKADVAAVLPEDAYSGAGVPSHGYASHTPCSDGERVYVFFSKSGALAFDMNGKQLWQTNVGKGSDPRRWGSASSPILYKDTLIVTASSESESVVGLDTKTGKQLWQAKAGSLSSLWGTPVLSKVDDERTAIVLGVDSETWGLNPTNGKLRWFSGSLAASNSSIVENNGVVYAVEGRGGKAGASKVGGKEDITKSHQVWTGTHTNRFSTPIVHKDRLYVMSSSLATCIDAKTGKEIYRERLPGGGGGGGGGGFGRGGSDYSSPVISGDTLYYMAASGATHVITTGDTFKHLAANRVTNDPENFSASPAISNGEIFIRSNRHLYCVSTSKKSSSLDRPNPAPVQSVNKDDTDAQVGPGAALAFEQAFRGPSRRSSKPIDLDCCCNILMLDKELWSKKQVLADFKANRTAEQVGAIVVVKTENCAQGTRLCAATTAALEKQATPLVGRFRVYMAWIKSNPEHQGAEWKKWEQDVIREYEFVQGPGARILVLVPGNGAAPLEWKSDASELKLTGSNLARQQGKTPELEKLLKRAIDQATSGLSAR